MSGKAAKIMLTEKQQAILQRIANAATATVQQRAAGKDYLRGVSGEAQPRHRHYKWAWTVDRSACGGDGGPIRSRRWLRSNAEKRTRRYLGPFNKCSAMLRVAALRALSRPSR